MKFSAKLSDFQTCLQKALPAMPRKSTLPVLEHLHFSLKNNALQVIATDQDVTIMTGMDVEGRLDGSILVPGRRISEIIKALGIGGNIEFSTNDDNYEITINSDSGKYTMKGLDHMEYLNIPELFDSEKPEYTDPDNINKQDSVLSVEFTKEEIKKCAEKTVFAVSNDEFRPAMNGVFFQFRSTYVNAVSTDSFRLVRAVVRSENAVYPEELDLIIPARSMDVLKKVDQDVKMSVIQIGEKITHVRFDIGDTIFISKLIDEKFPPWESVIPANNDLTAMFNQKDFLTAIKRVSIFTSVISHQIRVILEDNEIKITGEDEELGSQAKETIKCDYMGERFEIAFNYKYFEEAIQNLDGITEDNMLVMSFSEPTRPVILKPNNDLDDLLMLIMPVRIH